MTEPRYHFRRQAACVEYASRKNLKVILYENPCWLPVTGDLLLQCTADELREVADLICPKEDDDG